MSRQRIDLGSDGEQLAAAYLAEQGYRIETRNYRGRGGEIDIIARDHETYVFVEVKTRRDDRFGTPAEAVTAAKQRQIARVALEFLTRRRLHDEPARFDVVSVTVSNTGHTIEHITAAFEAP